MPAETTCDLDICVDCLLILANGECTHEACQLQDGVRCPTADGMADIWHGWDLVPACPEECEPPFSWATCDGCGSDLGGDRHHAVAFKRVRV